MLRSKSIVTGGEGGGSVVARELPRRDGDTWYQTFPAELKNLLGVDLRILDNEVIGEGSESTVYRAFLEGSEQVAVKRPRIRGFECLQRFKRECAILADLAPHPGIACLKGADPSPQRRALVLPLALGDLGTLLHDKGVRLGTNLALSYALQSAEALQHVHERGFIHRDVKSANLLVVPGWRNVVLSDFGLAQVQSTLAEKEARAASIAGNRGPTGGIYR